MLRVLADGERHGYEIKKRVERILGGRSINNNVLYPALRRFEEQGVIRRVAAQADPVLLADDNEFQTRVAFFDDLDAGDRLKIISARRQIVEEQLANLGALRPDAQAY